jgi:hypothetical protein
LEFFEINSPIKGWGEEMVKAALNRLSSDWQPTVVMDWSDGFWDKMKVQYNNLNWLNF